MLGVNVVAGRLKFSRTFHALLCGSGTMFVYQLLDVLAGRIEAIGIDRSTAVAPEGGIIRISLFQFGAGFHHVC
jgi:hypothetical protein